MIGAGQRAGPGGSPVARTDADQLRETLAAAHSSHSRARERLPLAKSRHGRYLLEAARFPWYYRRMCFPLLRRLLVALLLLTFVGGSCLSAAAAKAPSPCMTAMDAGMPMGGDVAKQAPSDRS